MPPFVVEYQSRLRESKASDVTKPSLAAILATILGLILAWTLTLALLDVDFTVNSWVLAVVTIGAIATVAALGATSVLAAFRVTPGRLLRAL